LLPPEWRNCWRMNLQTCDACRSCHPPSERKTVLVGLDPTIHTVTARQTRPIDG
jgi:hypothetical protein